MNRHEELVHPSFPAESKQMTRLAGNVVPIMGDQTSTNLNFNMNRKASTDWLDSFMTKPEAAPVVDIKTGQTRSLVHPETNK